MFSVYSVYVQCEVFAKLTPRSLPHLPHCLLYAKYVLPYGWDWDACFILVTLLI